MVNMLGCSSDDTASNDEGSSSAADTTGGDVNSTSSSGGVPTGSGSSSSGTTGDFASTTESSDGSSSHGSTSASTSSSSTEDSSSSGRQAVSCFDGGFPYAGSLCGVGGECVVELDELVDALPGARADAPGLVVDTDCEPQILTSSLNPDADTFAGLAVRDTEGVWTLEPAAETFNRGGLDYDADNARTQIMISGGVQGNRLWHRDDEGWTYDSEIASFQTVRSRGVIRTGDSTARAATDDSMVSINVNAFDGSAWSVLNSFQVGSAPELPHLMGVDDVWQATWMRTGAFDIPSNSFDRVVRWRSEGVTEEVMVASGWWPSSDWLPQALPLGYAATVGADGVPWILGLTVVEPGRMQTELAHRTGAGTWSTHVVETDDGVVCPTEGMTADELCDYDYVEARPLAVVAGANDAVLAFFAVADRLGTAQADCFGGGASCYWNDVSDDSEYSLQVAWLEDDAMHTSTLLSDARVTSMSAFVDDAGRVHLALVEGPPSASTIRYLRLAAP
ncbi:MAG: hypothetical protein ACRBN8_18385 [Nannocystales bacterium]